MCDINSVISYEIISLYIFATYVSICWRLMCSNYTQKKALHATFKSFRSPEKIFFIIGARGADLRCRPSCPKPHHPARSKTRTFLTLESSGISVPAFKLKVRFLVKELAINSSSPKVEPETERVIERILECLLRQRHNKAWPGWGCKG